jgi:hypothetical protein
MITKQLTPSEYSEARKRANAEIKAEKQNQLIKNKQGLWKFILASKTSNRVNNQLTPSGEKGVFLDGITSIVKAWKQKRRN